ncbi:MAG: helix-turn-helix domain-containing protein [Alphaproteobacteria bacterium]
MRKPQDKLIGANVRRFRLHRELTQGQLARKIKMTQVHVSRVEVGHQAVRSEVLIRIAKALKVKPWALLMSDAEYRKAYDLGML